MPEVQGNGAMEEQPMRITLVGVVLIAALIIGVALLMRQLSIQNSHGSE